jgi:hypothetical protein
MRVYTGSSWRNVQNGWVYTGNNWRQFFTFGTFQPEIRDGSAIALSYRNVGVALVGYRGYTASATSTYQWQYSMDGGVTWSNQTGTNNSGTYAATTLTTNYTTDTTDVNAIETIFLQSPSRLFYMRLRVTKSGETQFSQVVRIGKRFPLDSGSTLSLLRASTGLTYTLTGSASERNPYPNDDLFFTPNFTSTTNITNDTRPDYYVFNFSTNSGVTEKDSRIYDANPRNPLVSRRYTVQNSDLGGPVICRMEAWNSNESAPRVITITTRPVTTSALLAPINLVCSIVSGGIRGTWDAASGGNDNTITYVAYIYRDGSLINTTTSSTLTSFNYTTAQSGSYRFFVIASQSGNASVTSEFSTTATVLAPLAFSASIFNVTSEYAPSAFTINAPTLSATVLNRWDWTWTASSGATVYDSQITRPNGTTSLTTDLSATTDYWGISQTGIHRQTVTAKNRTTNYVRISWTKPSGTSAVSYRVIATRYIGVNGTPVNQNVGDVNYVDIPVTYKNDSNFDSGNSVIVYSVTAYSGPDQTGTSTVASSPSFPNNYSIANQISTTTSFREDFLSLENPTAGSLTVVGIPEPGQQISLVAGTGWSPAYENWSKTYDWIRSGVNEPSTASTLAAPVISATGASIGNELFCLVSATYKGTETSAFSTTILIVPAPPTYNLTDTFAQKFEIPGASSISATQYYGSYSGVGFGTIPETTITSTYTSPQLSVGNVSVTLYARKRVNIVYPSAQNNVPINSTRFTTQSISLQAAPQSTGQRRFLTAVYTVVPGTSFYISTNGYLGLQSTTSGNSVGVPSDGSWLNIANADLRQQYLYTLATSDGLYVRYRGNLLSSASQILEYQAYYPYSSGQVYVNFIENSLTNYLANVAWKSFGSTFSTWAGSSTTDFGSGTSLISTASMVRQTANDGVDDGTTFITVTAPAVPMNPNPTVTRAGRGFRFNVTDLSTGTFDSLASYATSTVSGTATSTINASTGLVTVTGMPVSSFATIRVAKARSGYQSTFIEVQGQALAGAAPVQTSTPTISASGSQDFSGTVRRIESGGSVSGSAGTYNNQESITSGILTILSNSYTGADSNWTGAGSLGSLTSITNAAAASSANMYRWRDRVTGTDGSVVDFYTPIIYRAVYTNPPGGTTSSTTNSITINYTGGSGPQRYYRFQDGSNLGFVADGGAGPFIASFTGLSADTLYNAQLFSGNNEGYLSVNFLGGNIRTQQAVSAPTNISQPTLSGGTVVGNTLTFGVGSWSGSPTSYALRLYRGTQFVATSETLVRNAGNTTSSTYTITQEDFNSGQRYFRAFATATNAGGTSNGGTFTAGQEVGPITEPVVVAPTITSGPSISWSSGNNFTLSASASNATNLEFEVQFANQNGGPVLRTQTFFFGASSGGGQTGAQANSWARTRVRANNSNSGLSSSFTGYSGWA